MLGLCLALGALADERELPLGDGVTPGIHVRPGDHRERFVLVPHENGPLAADDALADGLARLGYETWSVDPLGDRFLPPVASSMDRLPAGDIRRLIEAALADGRPVFLVGSGRAAIPLLRGIRAWQQAHPGRPGVRGLILLSPKLFVATPDPGQAGELMPVVRASNIPIYILQPEKSPWAWKLDRTVPALEAGGSDVFVQRLAGVRDRFYFRADAVEAEQELARRLPELLARAARLLQTLPDRPRQAVAAPAKTPPARSGKKERRLLPFAGDPVPPTLALPGLDGRVHRLRDYRGQVVMVNFWASWCPPCVHEMPSMQRLREHLRDRPFTILAVNMAEDEDTVRDFLDTRVEVDFPVLLDRDGAALKRWRVFAFPTTYVIGKQGRIRYALAGGVEWDRPEFLAPLQALLAE